MRKLFCGGTILVLAIAAVCFYFGSPGGWSSGSSTNEPEVASSEDYVIPEEPQPAASLPDQPVAIEMAPPVEVINVLEAQIASLRNQEWAAAQEMATVPERSVPVVLEPDDAAYRYMPPCTEEDDKLPALMPYASAGECASCDKTKASRQSHECERRKGGEGLKGVPPF